MSCKHCKYRIRILLLVLVTSTWATADVLAQGMSRSHGVGFRIGFWKTARASTLIRVTSSSAEISGVGVWFYFFSRFHDEWFFEFNLGTVASVRETYINDFEIQDQDVTAIIPFLFGMRYDFLSLRNQSAIQPYFSFGAGPYLITSVEPSVNNEEVNAGLLPGAYLGAGINLGLFSWFALNFDLKYHFVDLKFNEDLSGPEFAFGLSLMWGSKRDIIRVREVRSIVSDIYPAYYQFYNFYPLAIVSIENMTKTPVEVNVSSTVRGFSERTRESGFITVAARETKDIPITALLGPRIRNVANRSMAVLDLKIEARSGGRVTKEVSTPLMIHNRNSWNGEMDKLVFFVTSDDERILHLGRDLISGANFANGTPLRNLEIAALIFTEVGKLGLEYHRDPNIPFYQDDRVQYAFETLDLKSGDCDDLVVLLASLLESVGINTAFVEVRDPEKDLAHLYLMFNTAITAEQGDLVSNNDKRYLIRQNSVGHEVVWVPIETTLIGAPFEEAWKKGALQYLQEGILRNGLHDGWVRVIDVE